MFDPELLKTLAEFGLVGVVIAIFVWHSSNKDKSQHKSIQDIQAAADRREEKRIKTQVDERKEWREERTEWREDINRHSENTEKILTKLTDAIDRQRLHTRRSDRD